MRLEHLPDGSAETPLVRLYGFNTEEAARLMAAVSDLAAGRVGHVDVHGLPGVQSIGECTLSLRVGPRDEAIVHRGTSAFECTLTERTWDNVAGLIEPFATCAEGYQWLAGAPGEVALLLSASGEW